MNNTLLNTIVVEKVTNLPTDKRIKQHTRWIALQSQVPFVRTIFGSYINEFCHIHEGYSVEFINKKIN